MKHIKPLETVYSCVRFRSRLEARWAVFFDAMGMTWEYEPERFRLRDGRVYIPDFRLQGRMWTEVKPPGGDFDKAEKFHGQILLLEGPPGSGVEGLENVHRVLHPEWADGDGDDYVFLGIGCDDPGFWWAWGGGPDEVEFDHIKSRFAGDAEWVRVQAAIGAALSERFGAHP